MGQVLLATYCLSLSSEIWKKLKTDILHSVSQFGNDHLYFYLWMWDTLTIISLLCSMVLKFVFRNNKSATVFTWQTLKIWWINSIDTPACIILHEKVEHSHAIHLQLIFHLLTKENSLTIFTHIFSECNSELYHLPISQQYPEDGQGCQSNSQSN